MSRTSDMPEGTRVNAMHYTDHHDEGVRKDGVITDNLSIMYFITFDDGTDTYEYKVADVRRLDDE